MEKQIYEFDTIILGGGPAGLSAAIYSARGENKTAIIDITMLGGQPSNYLELENYPGFSVIGGYDLMEKFEEHADKFGVEKFPMQEIEKVDLLPKIKIIETKEAIFKAKTVIIATGAQAKKLGIAGEKEFVGRGVSYCAVCDGAFYKDKTVAVIGGGNAAVEEGMYLTKSEIECIRSSINNYQLGYIDAVIDYYQYNNKNAFYEYYNQKKLHV